MTVPPEADLEAHLGAILPELFPGISTGEIDHQTYLTLQFGRNEIVVNGKTTWKKGGRADIIINHKGKAIAVIELKRADLNLSEADIEQGRNYARVLPEIAPLVIVTNGTDTWLIDSYTGEKIEGDHVGADLLKQLFSNAGKIAADKRQSAIEALLGTESDVWPRAVRAATRSVIQRLTSLDGDARKPRGRFHVVRQAAVTAISSFDRGVKTIVIEGAPLSGKTNALMSFAMLTECKEADYVMLLIRGAMDQASIYEKLADVLGVELGWQISADDARNWLRRLGNSSNGPTLVLGIDDVEKGSRVAKELETLAEAGIGDKLKLLVTSENRDDILKSKRDASVLSDSAVVAPLGKFNDREFSMALRALSNERISFDEGAELSSSHRVPWILRAEVDAVPQPLPDGTEARLPASVGVELIHIARARLNDLGEIRRPFRELARALLANDAAKSPQLALNQAGAFVIPIAEMGSRERESMRDLVAGGWLREYRHAGGEDVAVPTVPELFLSELTEVVSTELEKHLNDPAQAAAWLSETCSGLFLGDVIGAQAIIDYGRRSGGLANALLWELYAIEPKVEQTGAALLAMAKPDGNLLYVKVDENGGITPCDRQGIPIRKTIETESDDTLGVSVSRQTAWTILAQLTRVPMAAVEDLTNEVDMADRIDLQLMFSIGECPFPLVHGSNEPIGHLVHDFGAQGTALAREHALAEPVTMSMRGLLAREWKRLDEALDAMAQEGSVPLLVRMHNALHAVLGSSEPGLTEWASRKLSDGIVPALRGRLGIASESSTDEADQPES